MIKIGCPADVAWTRTRRTRARDLRAAIQTLGVAVAIVTLGSGCQSKISTNDRRTSGEPAPAETPPPRGEPVEIAGSLAAERTVFQSRGVITLDVSPAALKLGESFSLVNDTTKATLIDSDSSGLALMGDEAMADAGWHLGGGYDVTLRLFLMDPAIQASFAPGDNTLRLLVDASDGGAPRLAKTLVTLHDFDVQGLTIGSFETSEQRTGGFQGGFELFTRFEVTSGAGKAFLSSGFMAITNE